MVWESVEAQKQKKREGQWKSRAEQRFLNRKEEYAKLLKELTEYCQYLVKLATSARGPEEFLSEIRDQIQHVKSDIDKTKQVLS